MNSRLELLIGRSWGHRLIIGTTVGVYVYLLFTDPAAAMESARRAIDTLVRLFSLIVASLLLASALESLLPEEAVMRYLGEDAGLRNTVFAGFLGGILLGGPYATYPIMESVYKSGAGYGALVAMYVGYGVIGIGRVPFGLVIFSPKIVLLRLVFAVALTTVAAVAIWAFLPEHTVDVGN
ncbi:MAG: permease [Halodesulfurarchaeum sp.]